MNTNRYFFTALFILGLIDWVFTTTVLSAEICGGSYNIDNSGTVLKKNTVVVRKIPRLSISPLALMQFDPQPSDLLVERGTEKLEAPHQENVPALGSVSVTDEQAESARETAEPITNTYQSKTATIHPYHPENSSEDGSDAPREKLIECLLECTSSTGTENGEEQPPAPEESSWESNSEFQFSDRELARRDWRGRIKQGKCTPQPFLPHLPALREDPDELEEAEPIIREKPIPRVIHAEASDIEEEMPDNVAAEPAGGEPEDNNQPSLLETPSSLLSPPSPPSSPPKMQRTLSAPDVSITDKSAPSLLLPRIRLVSKSLLVSQTERVKYNRNSLVLVYFFFVIVSITVRSANRY